MSFGADIYGWFGRIDARIWQAVIGGSFLALGWLFNGWRNRHDARNERAERLRDVHKAIFAEIKSYVEGLNSDHLDSYGVTMVQKMRAGETAGTPFIPFIPIERNDTVYRSIVSDIHILPRATIDAVVLYYSQLEAISALVEDMRSEAFKAIDTKRRIQIYQDYINMKKLALDIGELCLKVIAAYAEDGKEAAEAIFLKNTTPMGADTTEDKVASLSEDQINTPDEASSDR